MSRRSSISGPAKDSRDASELLYFLEGPFALLDTGGKDLELLALQPQHMHYPPGFTAILNEISLPSGSYRLKIDGIQDPTKIVDPGKGKGNDPIVLDKCREKCNLDKSLVYCHILIPKPTEIWPVMPEKAKIAPSKSDLPKATSRMYATKLLLRYKHVDLSSIALDVVGTSTTVEPLQFPWTPAIVPVGGVGILTFDMQRKDLMQMSPHKHAEKAFILRSHMLGIERYVEYPLMDPEGGPHSDCQVTQILIDTD
jgi:hypothetical protein